MGAGKRRQRSFARAARPAALRPESRPAAAADASNAEGERAGSSPLFRRKDVWLAIALVVSVLVSYSPAFRAGFIWDDDLHILDNTTLHEPGGLAAIWFQPSKDPQYYPLVFTSFWIEHHLWGLRPFGYHLVNVLLHASACLALWRVLRRIGIPAAWWVAAIFALHPVHVESVAWVTERKNVLSLLLYLLAAGAYLRSEELLEEGWRRPARRCYLLSFGLYLLALFSKTVTCSLPVALAVVHLLRRERLDRRILRRLVPFLAAGLLLGLFTASQEFAGTEGPGEEFAIPFVQRLLVATTAPWFYLGKLFWPHPLVFFYPRWEVDPAAAVWWSGLVGGLVLAALLAWLWLRRDLRAPALACAFFVATLFPALGFFDVYPFRYSFVADHFQYHASIGILALAVAGVVWAARRTPIPAAVLTRVGAALGVALLLLLATRTRAQCRDYLTLEGLWHATLAKNPGAWNVLIELGNIHFTRGELDEAERLYRESIRASPHAEAYYDLGNALGARADAGRKAARDAGQDAASEERRRAAQVDEQAVEAYLAAVSLKPRYVKAHYNLALRLERLGRTAEAVEHHRRAIQIEPRYQRAHYSLGRDLQRLGQLEEAEASLRRALKMLPEDEKARRALAEVVAARAKSAGAAGKPAGDVASDDP